MLVAAGLLVVFGARLINGLTGLVGPMSGVVAGIYSTITMVLFPLGSVLIGAAIVIQAVAGLLANGTVPRVSDDGSGA